MVRSKQVENDGDVKKNGRKSLGPEQLKKERANGRKSLPSSAGKDDESSVGSDEDSSMSILKLDLHYPKLQPTLAQACTHSPSSVVCDECMFSGGLMIECQGQCQRSFHAECLGQIRELELPVQPLANKRAADEDKCEECRSGRHLCFACKLEETDQVTRKCAVASCGKFYHEKCMKASELFRKDASWTPNKPAYICPHHTCNSCWADQKVQTHFFQ